MNNRTRNVLFVCTGNSCRSIMAEALLNELGKPGFRACSAGSRPAGFVHPHALACLNRNRIPVYRPHSKSLDEFLDSPVDLVVTVCDQAAAEACPLFTGSALKVHWGVPDPALATGADTEIAPVFQAVFDSLRGHIEAFVKACEADGDSDLATIVARLGAPAEVASS